MVFDCPGEDLPDSPLTRVGLLQNGHRLLRLSVEDRLLARQLRFMFRHFVTDATPDDTCETLTVAGQGGDFCVRYNGRPLWQP
ncbi:hypothetical protein [Antarctobacter sp.]|uniref:hypothetical protein n=1 Tax=Antarctobacter sp. TaxID=1872577 RepID=UPI002B27234C|nr:hypothetical protein [Antarctobacter sp.]